MVLGVVEFEGHFAFVDACVSLCNYVLLVIVINFPSLLEYAGRSRCYVSFAINSLLHIILSPELSIK